MEDLTNHRDLFKLEKILPVLNGLIYQKKENRESMYNNSVMARVLLDIFRYEFPIEMHENALFAFLNLISEAPKAFKDDLLAEEKSLQYLYKFLSDLFSLQKDIVDY
mmetsp:Transcript_39726/g.38296  ORF Transcript_39726/g.38296 Transcript_39726/m.38296 type:complete len:107 (+) Transcript_39726:1183-1503(+)